jgi:hypothetical protein
MAPVETDDPGGIRLCANELPQRHSGSDGNEGHRQILERMRAATKIPVTTSSLVLADAFHHLSLQRILAICSWRPDSLQLDNLRNFLRVSGIEIAAVEGIGKQLSSIEKTKLTPAQIYDNAVQAGKKHPEVDAVYIQSGTMATADIIEPLENELGKPVLSAHIANIWGSFKPLNIKVGSGYGALLEFLGADDEPAMRAFLDDWIGPADSARAPRENGLSGWKRARVRRKYARTLEALRREGVHCAPQLIEAYERE